MSLKSVFLLLFILLCGTFVFLKMMVLGDPNSDFNKTTRLSMGQYPLARTVLGLHDYGDARKEFLMGTSEIEIKWYRPQLEEVDKQIAVDFAKLVAKYTGRPARAIYGGVIDDAQLNKDTDLRTNKLLGASDSTTLYVFFSEDYKPRGPSELSSTYEENGIIISLRSHRDFLKAYPEKVKDYLLSSLLHEFGHQLGLEHNSYFSCIMNSHAGVDGNPLEIVSGHTPEDFCPEEIKQIQAIKLQLAK